MLLAGLAARSFFGIVLVLEACTHHCTSQLSRWLIIITVKMAFLGFRRRLKRLH
jgi:hypothetical protein